MKTKRNYSICFSNYCISVDDVTFFRIREWAVSNETEFQLVETENFCKESYKDEATNEYGGDAKPTESTYSIRFCSDFPNAFFSSLAYFRWKTE